QAKPEQRRRVLEEAAGVAGLHARRHEAELRLKAAETNLNRLEDVIGQLAQQIDALKRQARQAVRYKQVSADVRKAEATLFHLRFLAANAEVAEAGHAKDVSIRRVAEATGAQAVAATHQANAAADLPPLRDDEARAGAALQRLVMAREQPDRAVSENSVRLMRLEGQIGEVERELASLDKPENGAPHVAVLASAADAARNEVTQAEAAALRAEAAHSGARQALDVARAPLAEA